MPRIRLLASSLALAICTITAAQAQQFTGVISFGDSLSDDGNVAALNGLPPGNSFTTNPDPEAVQIIASAFGFNQTNISPLVPGSNGTDWAYGGACVEANSATFQCGLSPGAFSVTTQVTNYLTSTGGSADSHALYTMWGGANDIFTYLGLAGAGVITPTQAQIGTATAAATEAGLINALQTAGAGNIIVFNLPDIGKTPELALEGPAAQQAATGLVLTFNGQLNLAMSGKTGIIPVDTFGLVNEVLANPTLYGFTNVTGMACATGPGVGGLPSSVACGPASDAGKLPYTYAPGTNLSYFFADGVHPTGAAGALLASAVLSEIEAPSYISMLGEVPLQVFDTATRADTDQMEADMGGSRQDGTLRSFASFDYSRQRYNAESTSPNTTSDDETLITGADYYVNSAVSLGMSTTFSHQDASFVGGGGFRNNEPLVSAFGVWHTPDVYVSLLGAIGALDFTDIQRAIVLGPTTRLETGSTDGSQLGYQLEAGYFFHWNDIKTGPYVNVQDQRIHVGEYSETGGDSTSMTFGAQVRDSLISSIGWQLSGDSKVFDGSIHPFARVSYEHESDTDVRDVSAGLTTLNGTFSMPGFQPDTSWWDGELGLSAAMGNNLTAYVAYNGQFGNSTERVDSINLGVKWTW